MTGNTSDNHKGSFKSAELTKRQPAVTKPPVGTAVRSRSQVPLLSSTEQPHFMHHFHPLRFLGGTNALSP